MNEETYKKRRLELHQKMCECVGPDIKVYYTPPENQKLSLPCIRYKRSNIISVSAEDKNDYARFSNYEIVVLDTDPDSFIPIKLLDNFNYISFSTQYISNGVYHTVLRLIY